MGANGSQRATHNFRLLQVTVMGSPMNYADDQPDLLELCFCRSLCGKQDSWQMVQMKSNA